MNWIIGKVLLLDSKLQQEIGEATKMHQKNEVMTSLDVGGCDLDCFLEGMGWLEKLSNLVMSFDKRLVKLRKCIERWSCWLSSM